jgi:hypothetical protein
MRQQGRKALCGTAMLRVSIVQKMSEIKCMTPDTAEAGSIK